ncbi:MAG: peptidase, partial [Planctomycetaceae bacterium]|nr:peptidase [Planctomycetaceae bacterium]
GNNRSVYEHVAEFMAASVGEKVPFRIEVETPKVPLVRNGAMELKVKAIREGDFKGPIAVRFLYNPPGVSASGGVSIAEGQTEALIPVTANANAEVKAWPMVIMAEANVGNGSALISSKFFNLDVAEAFFTIAFKPSAAEQGQEGVVAATLANQVEFNGKAKVELIGLPAESTAEPIEITKDSEEISFNVKTTAKTPPGKHKTLVARILVPQAGEQIVHMLGTGELRVDTPLPPKPTKPNAAPAAAVATTPKPAAAAKPLSRLEMLRKERESVGANNEKKQ